MALSIVAAGTAVTGTSSLSIPYYAGLAANDIAFIWAGSSNTSTIGTISGFTALAQQTATASGRLFWARLTGSESGNVSLTLTSAANSRAVMFGVRGAIDTGTPYEDQNTASGNGTPESSQSITTSVVNTLGLRVAFDVASGNTGSPPSGWSNIVDTAATVSSTFHVDYKALAAIDTEPASNRTLANNGRWITQTLAVLPSLSTPIPVFMNHYRNNGLA